MLSRDIEVELVSHRKLIGRRVFLIRVGSFTDHDSSFNAKEMVKKMAEKTYRVPRMRFTAQKNAFSMATAVHMPIKDDEDDDDDETDSESEAEDAATGDGSASAAAAAAAAHTTTNYLPLSPTLAVPLDRKVSVQIDLEEKDTHVTVKVGSGAVMTWTRVPKRSSLNNSDDPISSRTCSTPSQIMKRTLPSGFSCQWDGNFLRDSRRQLNAWGIFLPPQRRWIRYHYLDPNQKKHEYWYKPVYERLAHEVDEMLSVQFIFRRYDPWTLLWERAMGRASPV
jgi:hypothetical protein